MEAFKQEKTKLICVKYWKRKMKRGIQNVIRSGGQGSRESLEREK